MDKKFFYRMGHTALTVNNLEESLKFYKDLLGCNPVWEKDSDWAQLSLGGDDISLVQKSEGRALHPPHVGFRVKTQEELSEVHASLAEKGIKVEPIKEHRDGTVSFYFKDPSGNLLEALWDERELP